jgi:hypothetical protein
VFRQLHCGIERTYQAILDDTCHGQGAPAKAAKVRLYRRGGCIGRQFKRRHLGFRSDLLVSRSTPRTPLVNSLGGHWLPHGRAPLSLSVRITRADSTIKEMSEGNPPND